MAIPVPGRRFWSLLPLLLFCAGISPRVVGDSGDFTYRSSASEVRLSFSATDQNDHGVATLQSSDFAVVDKDVIVRNFQSFTRSDWSKLEIAILVDASGSVTPRFRQELTEVLNLVSQTSGIPDENLAMFSFQGLKPALLCAGNCQSLATAERLLPERSATGLTPLFDAILFASEFLGKRGDSHSQRILILFSDGADTASENSLRDTIDDSLRHDLQLDCIDLNPPSRFSLGTGTLQTLARSTGGHYFPAPDGGAHALQVILEGFQASYTVSYRLPTRVPGFHSIRILPTHNRNLQFRSRSGYYYPEQTR